MWMPTVAVASENLWAAAFSGNTPGLGGTGLVSGSVQQALPPVTVGPGTPTFAVVAGGTPTAQDLTIANNDSQPHTVAILASGGSWLSLSPAEATVQAQSTLPVPVRIDPGSLNAGPYPDQCMSPSMDGPYPRVSSRSTSLSRRRRLNTTDLPSSRSITRTNSNGTAVDVTIQEAGSWLG